MNEAARLVLIRHGETEWARSGQHTGRTDIPLTARGEEQAHLTGKAIARLGLRNPLVISSPRQRALRTAELAGLTVDRVWDDLCEWDYGEYEGLTTPQIRETVPHWTVFTHPCPGGETADAVQARADTVLSVVEPQLANRDVILIGHGHFSRVLIARWNHLPANEGRRFAMAAAAITVLGYEHGAKQIQMLNCTPEG
ncbi:acid phosphatase [Skermania sp. ID1734]|uniref:acid phosphatase n=1 Tax=Skermania sp. ID1734 TaxID=2597516 RepID=UPI00117F5650|nr:acid phosphatase [Skermania sp. ID1734]TSD97320.1 acid phosphatase [Skermania sp. ID1734]